MNMICPHCGNDTTFTWRRDSTLGEHGERWEQEYDECDTCHAYITGADWLALEEDETPQRC